MKNIKAETGNFFENNNSVHTSICREILGFPKSSKNVPPSYSARTFKNFFIVLLLNGACMLSEKYESYSIYNVS
jgi:hypothetical protein